MCPDSQPGLPEPPPEGPPDLKGISAWEFLTMWPGLYLSHLFLPLWHRENGSQSLGGSLAFLQPIHHKPSPQRMDHFHACFPACLLPPLAGPCLHVLQSSPCACCNYPLHGHTSPGILVDNFIFFPATTGIDCDGQRPVICGHKSPLPAVFLHKTPMFDHLGAPCELH